MDPASVPINLKEWSLWWGKIFSILQLKENESEANRTCWVVVVCMCGGKDRLSATFQKYTNSNDWVFEQKMSYKMVGWFCRCVIGPMVDAMPVILH